MNFKKNLDFTNMNAYVLGGSGLIGAKVSRLLLKLNANLIVLDKKKLILNSNQFKFSFVKMDLTNVESFNFNKMFQDYGSPNIFINTSYPITSEWGNSSFRKLSFKNMTENIDLHLNSYIWTAKKFADEMSKKNSYGSIVLLSSIYGFQGQDLNLYKNTKMEENATYSVVKGGIINYVKQMSSFYGKFDIRINSISPGGLYGHNKGLSTKTQNKTFLRRYCKKNPLQRLGYADEVAKLTVFLSSRNASYMTGTNVVIDGGISIV